MLGVIFHKRSAVILTWESSEGSWKRFSVTLKSCIGVQEALHQLKWPLKYYFPSVSKVLENVNSVKVHLHWKITKTHHRYSEWIVSSCVFRITSAYFSGRSNLALQSYLAIEVITGKEPSLNSPKPFLLACSEVSSTLSALFASDVSL